MRKNGNIFLYFQYLYEAIETESTEGSEVERSDNSFTSSHEISGQASRRGRRVLRGRTALAQA